MAKSAHDFFTPEQQEDIKHAIQSAELDTSGEIKVHIENTCPGEVLDRAALIFNKLGMNKTELRNGVLFYLAVANRKFAVIGDAGINAFVEKDFWDRLKSRMADYFRQNQFTEGLMMAIHETGLELKKYFPYKTNDINELDDEISFGDEE